LVDVIGVDSEVVDFEVVDFEVVDFEIIKFPLVWFIPRGLPNNPGDDGGAGDDDGESLRNVTDSVPDAWQRSTPQDPGELRRVRGRRTRLYQV
jgi:hypothetical protein